MRVNVEGRALELSPAEVVGQGGEAIVYRKGDRAIKIFTGLGADALAAKAEKIARYPKGAPAEVIAPLAAAYDTKGRLAGYAMRFIEGALDGQRLSSKKTRGGVLGAEAMSAWLASLARVVDGLHRAGVVVGDLNEGNVLLAEGRAWIIDADSHQFAGLPCTVAHEKFLDPRLYGVDLGRVGALSVESDWYAFAVLAFSVLLGAHPYGGVHPSIGTLVRRAEARVSVLRPEVVKPKSATSADVLPDALVAWFGRVFDGDLRERMPEPLLALTWTTCACGLEHARILCPACAHRGVLRARPSATRHGRVRAARVFSGRRVLIARTRLGALEYLGEREDGVVVREDGTTVPNPGWRRVALAGRKTLVADGRCVSVFEGGVERERLFAGTVGGEAMFDACGAHLVRIEGDHLVDAEGGLVGSILEGSTGVFTGMSMGYGYYRAGKVTEHFVWRAGRAGLRRIELPSIEGRLLGMRAYFDGVSALVAWREEIAGKERASLFRFELDGRVLASLVGAPDSSPLLASVEGFALAGTRILKATDRGIYAVELDAGTMCPGALFVDAEPFVEEGCELLPGPGGSLYVVTEGRITHLVLEGDSHATRTTVLL